MNIIVKVKKIGIILLATLIFFTGSFAFPNTEQKAHAVGFGLAIPGGVTLGAGTYALGALGLAGIVGLAGYAEYEEEINAHAKGVWEGGTQTAMDSLNVSIEAAKGLGNGVVNLQGDFINFMEGKLQSIAAHNTNLQFESSVNVSEYYSNTVAYGNTTTSNFATNNSRSEFKTGNYSSALISLTVNSTRLRISGVLNTPIYIYEADLGTTLESLKSQIYAITSISGFNAFASKYLSKAGVAYSGTYHISAEESYQQGVSKVNEAWESMRDAGLVLPVDSAVPLSSVDGSPLTYNPTADNYTGIDGGVYEGTPAWAFPQPKIRVANPDIPNSVPTTGVYVDTPVLTGNPAHDDTIINNPAIPKTTTNIQTGVTVGNPDIPNVSNPPIEGEIPPTTPPPSKWEKPPTKKPPNIGALVTTKFPFSLPWDFFGVLGWINAEPKAPVFKLDTGLKTPFGKELKMDMEFKFNFLDPYMGFFRGFIIIGFSLFLILATRRLLGGAG